MNFLLGLIGGAVGGNVFAEIVRGNALPTWAKGFAGALAGVLAALLLQAGPGVMSGLSAFLSILLASSLAGGAAVVLLGLVQEWMRRR